MGDWVVARLGRELLRHRLCLDVFRLLMLGVLRLLSLDSIRGFLGRILLLLLLVLGIVHC